MNSGNFSYKDRLLFIGFASTFILFPMIILFFQGHEHLETAQSFCPFMLLTGLPCPGCGLTKSLVYLLRGDMERSISFHLFGPVVGVGSIIVSGISIMEMITQKRYLRAFYFNVHIAYVLGILLGAYHLIRLLILIYSSSLEDILRASIWK